MICTRTRIHRSLSLLLTIALCGGVMATPAMSWAQDDEITAKVEELSARGVELYSKGKFNEAIAIFEQAYRLTPVANLLYNIALCWEKLDDGPNAVKSYERFIVADDADPEIRKKALARIKELNDQIEQRRLAEERARQGNGGGIEANKGDGKGVVGDKGQKDPDPTTDDGGGGLLVGGLVTAGIGVAVVGGGVAFGVLAADDVDQFGTVRTAEEKDSKKSSAESNALLADIFYGVGGAAIVAGIVMIALDSGGGEAPAEGATSSVQVIPMWGPGGAGAVLSASF